MKTIESSAGQQALPLAVPAGLAPGAGPVPTAEFANPRDVAPRFTLCESPIGELLLTGDGRSVTGLYMRPDDGFSPVVGSEWRRDPGLFRDVERQLDAYFGGELTAFDLPLAPCGTPFQRAVWRRLTAIPYGATTTYGAIATALGRPSASRAVGAANGRNPISVIIPCHRVIGADGSLTGYGGGLPRKQRLLALERAARPRKQDQQD